MQVWIVFIFTFCLAGIKILGKKSFTQILQVLFQWFLGFSVTTEKTVPFLSSIIFTKPFFFYRNVYNIFFTSVFCNFQVISLSVDISSFLLLDMQLALLISHGLSSLISKNISFSEFFFCFLYCFISSCLLSFLSSILTCA